MGFRTPRTRRRNGLAAFRAVEPEVLAALGAGWTLVAIFEEKQTRLGMTYSQFARYAKPLREALRAGVATPRVISAPAASSAADPSPTTTKKGPPKGRPEDAVPTLNMDGFATQVLRNEDLF